jgi:two-component system, LuxR family, response regulator FixJ
MSAGRVCLVDDNADFGESVAFLLDGLGYDVIAFERPSAFLAALEDDAGLQQGTCLLLDVRMPEMSGLQFLDALRERGIEGPVIFMTGHGDVPLAVEAMRKGALTFLEKPFQESALETALLEAFSGERVRTVPASGSVSTAALASPEYEQRRESLTPREREVMDLVVEGHPNKVVAYRLDISPKTVELHRSRVMAKMQASSLTQLVRMVMSGSVESAQ